MSLNDDASSRILALIRSKQWTVTETREKTKWKLGARKGAAGVLVVGPDREVCIRHLAEGCGIATEEKLVVAHAA
jgi:hypothetical protein